MSNPHLSINIKFPDWLKRLTSQRDRISRFIAANVQTNRGMMFDKEGAYNGHRAWAPLKYREGQILSLTGTLRRSIAPSGANGNAGPNGTVVVRGDLKKLDVAVGTKVAYANMMNFGTSGLPGGVLRPKKKSVLRFKIGNKWVFAHEVKIPARRFDQWNSDDALELRGALTGLVTEILNGR